MEPRKNPVGRTIGRFEIQAFIGAGGMGQVYRARHTRLGRDVALKILPDEFSEDRERLMRSEREAKLLASLNHPNIAAIYDLEESDDVRCLVLEFVEGETLAQRLKRGRLSVPETLGVCGQIAEALEAAHEKGIVHRDLKPGNVMITAAGNVKVLDFGIAKIFEAGGWKDSPTGVDSLSAGIVLGTPSYMSPEQARAQPVDRRTDIWAFGCLLFECLAGRQAFSGETTADIMTQVLDKQPDWEALPALTPARIRDLAQRCLQKDAHRRLHDIADARIEIEDAMTPGAPPTIAAPAPRAARRLISMLAIAIGALAVGVVATVALLPPLSMDLSALNFTPLSRMETTERFPAWSPDGKTIAFTANVHGIDQVFTKTIDSPVAGEAAQITNAPFRCARPFWSRDGSKIYYQSDNKLWSVTATGADKLLGSVDLPASTDFLAGFSMHPDGTRFLTSIGKYPYDIWMMEGLNPPKSWLDRLLRR
jgi:hypothetical protein